MRPLRHICGEIVHTDDEGNYFERFDRRGIGTPIIACLECGEVLEEGWFRPLYLVEPMNDRMLIRTMEKNCSNCWGHGFITQSVTATVLDGETGEETGAHVILYRVLCAACLEETRGYVTNRYIGNARNRDLADYGLAIVTLGKEMGLYTEPEARRSAADLLIELGF
jgi:hypothetical protein